MRRILLTLGILCFWAGAAAAEQAVVMIPEANYKAIMNQLDTMQKRIDQLEQQKGTVAAVPTAQPATGGDQYDKLSQDVSNIYDSLDLVETKTLRDRVNMGIELRTRMDNWKVEKFWRLTDQLGYVTTLTTFQATGEAWQTAGTAYGTYVAGLDPDPLNWTNDQSITASQLANNMNELAQAFGALQNQAGNYTASAFDPMTQSWDPASTGKYVPAGYPVPRLRNESNDNSWTNRFRINMGADIAKGLKFTGRLAVYKDWATNDSAALANDANAAHITGDTNIKLDRAYIDWIPDLPIPLAFTIGRQPSSEGPGNEFKENKLRQSTYPALIFDGESDGVVTTLGLERYTGLKSSAVRAYYAKGFQSNDAYTVFLDNQRQDLSDTNVYGAFFETELPGVNDSLCVLSYVNGNDFPDMFENKVTLGDMDLYGAHIQAGNFMSSGLDLFLSLGMNVTHPNGEFYNMTAQNPMTGSLITDPRNGELLTVPMGGLFTSTPGDTESQNGYAVYAGVRYTLPMEALNQAKIGFEYNHGSEYWFSYTWGSSELYNKLATRGDVFDFYYLQPFNDNLFMRTGYTMVNYDYTGSGMHLGKPMESEAELRNFYVTLDVRF